MCVCRCTGHSQSRTDERFQRSSMFRTPINRPAFLIARSYSRSDFVSVFNLERARKAILASSVPTSADGARILNLHHTRVGDRVALASAIQKSLQNLSNPKRLHGPRPPLCAFCHIDRRENSSGFRARGS